MSISTLFALFGGLALFLFGMDLMSAGLELLAGRRMHNIIEKLTSNTARGVVVGLVVTGIIQSSSATTVMCVGFVNAGLMTLRQAVGVIMGANIGTTVTGQLVALNITDAAPMMAFFGFCLFKFVQKNTWKHTGQVLMGLGLLFMGMDFMSSAMSPLRDSPTFVSWMTTLSNPLTGIVVGAAVTAIIQSSSASLGILQALANKGLIGLHGSMYIVFGFNIGTCITSVLSSIGSSRSGKSTAVVHILFNVLGTVLFFIIIQLLPVDQWIVQYSKNLPAAQIANFHTLFNIVTTVLLFPFSRFLADAAEKIVPQGEEPILADLSLHYIHPRTHKEPPVILTDVRAETRRMLSFTQDNFKRMEDLFHHYSKEIHEEIFHNEKAINYLNSQITRYIIEILPLPMEEELASYFTAYLRIVRDLERVGDHTKSLAEFAHQKEEHHLDFSTASLQEISVLNDHLEELYNAIFETQSRQQRGVLVRAVDRAMQRDVELFRDRHIDRMKLGICDPESGLIYEKMLSNYERISAYLRNVGKLSL